MENKKSVWVCLLTYNEEDNLKVLIRKLMKNSAHDFQVLITQLMLLMPEKQPIIQNNFAKI